MKATGRAIKIPLNRPEYVAVPEALITALAWKIYAAPSLTERQQRKPVGLYFRGSKPQGRNVEYKSTDPQLDQLAALAGSLEAAGVHAEGDGVELASAVVNSVLGIRVERSGMQPASPISPSFALLQNTRGLLRKQNPPDLGDILQSMYSFGLIDGDSSESVAGRWNLAALHRMAVDPLVAALDKAMDDALIQRVERTTPDRTAGSEFQGLFPETPFEWFATAWNRLTAPAWVEALPARVWVDWATTLLRLAFGAGFLWESGWYLALAREVVTANPIRSLAEVQSSVGEIIPWASSRAGTAARDIAPKLSRRVHQGEHVRHALAAWMSDNDVDDLGFAETIQRMRDDKGFSDVLLAALGTNTKLNSGTNLWEAIKYALMTRDASGRNPDYYGLLQSRGRFLTVAPGTEWIAVVASLACETPGGTTDIARVISSLEMLGTRPELRDLVGLLERAGLARGSADADSGVLVESAF